MKIAVTYENGQIFQHFGHTEQFKVYTVENRKITDTTVVDANGQGHGALAGLLKTIGADAIICGASVAELKWLLQKRVSSSLVVSADLATRPLKHFLQVSLDTIRMLSAIITITSTAEKGTPVETTDAAVISVTDRSALYLREKCKKIKQG